MSEHVCPLKIHVEVLISSVMYWGRGELLGHESRALMTGMTALLKEAPESFLGPSIVGGHSEHLAVCSLEEGLHQNPAVLTP